MMWLYGMCLEAAMPGKGEHTASAGGTSSLSLRSLQLGYIICKASVDTR
jgi:hypothetical protein